MVNNTAARRVAPTPAHVPASLVYDFDLFFDPALINDPHERILDIAKNAPPIFWSPYQGGHWVIAGHAEVFEASRDWSAFTSEIVPYEELIAKQAALPAGAAHIPSAFPINLDPPHHTIYRMPLNGAFSPKVMSALKESIRELARRLAADMATKNHCDLMPEFAEQLPVQVFLRLFGLPLERFADYRAIVVDHAQTGYERDRDKNIKRLQKVAAVMRPTFEERRDHPQDDVISRLWNVKIDGRATTMEDLENYGVLLFIAGLDTVMQGIGFGVRHLARDVELQERLRRNRADIPGAVEEILRRYTFTCPPRVVAKDQSFFGVEMKAGEFVSLFLPGANLDSRRFAHPERVDIDRDDKAHIAFGAGPHRCLGSHLARIELEIAYEELLQSLPTFRLDPDRPAKFHGGNTLAITSLHLLWDTDHA